MKPLRFPVQPDSFIDVGDVLIDKNGNRRTVIAKTANYLRLTHKNTTHPGSWWSLESLAHVGDKFEVKHPNHK